MARTRVQVRSRSGSGTGGAPASPVPDVPGFRLGPPLGFGARGPVWSATALPGGTVAPGRACAVSLLRGSGPGREERQRRRLDALVGWRHESLAEVLAVVPVTDGCAVVSERLDGPTLAVLRSSRSALTPAEIVSVLRPLADGLARLHALGVTHGDVSPANVVLCGRDRPVLVDLAGEVAFEAGTRGFLAPERTLGSAAGPSGDVWSLATTALWLADAAERSRLREVLAPALVPDPAARCSARQLAALAAGLAEPGEVMLPSASSLAQGSLRARAVLEETRPAATRRPRPVRRGSGRHRGGRAARSRRRGTTGRVRFPSRRPGGRFERWRAAGWHTATALAVLAAVAAATAVTVAGGTARFGLSSEFWRLATSAVSGTDGPAPGERAVAGIDAEAAADVVRATRDLYAARDDALNRGDPEALARLSLPGSPAARDDAALVGVLTSGASDITGLETRVGRVSVLDVTDGAARVEVRSRQSAYSRVGVDGAVRVPEQPERCVVLDLERAAGSWVLRDGSDCRSGRLS